MARTMIYLDSFDHYVTGSVTEKATQVSGQTGIVAGRTGNGWQTGAGVANASYYKILPGGPYLQLNVGVAYKTNAYTNFPIRLRDIGNGTDCYIQHIGDGRLQPTGLLLGNGRQFGGISVTALNIGQWYYLEASYEVNAGAKTIAYTLKINENIESSGTFTFGTSPPYGACLTLAGVHGPGGGGVCIIDDFYVAKEGFFGDIAIGVIRPNGVGITTQWTPTAGNNWQNVDDLTSDEDTTIVSATANGLRDLYEMEDISADIPLVYAAQGLILVKKTLPGQARLRPEWGTNAAVADGLIYYPSATDYIYSIDCKSNNPVTGVPWTVSEINALQYGMDALIP